MVLGKTGYVSKAQLLHITAQYFGSNFILWQLKLHHLAAVGSHILTTGAVSLSSGEAPTHTAGEGQVLHHHRYFHSTVSVGAIPCTSTQG